MKINQTIVDRIYDEIKEEITTLKVKLGARINIQKISEYFSVSQTPIREALSRLVKDGLVVYKPRKGYYITQLTGMELEEIYDLRKMIECYALEKGIKNIDKSKMKEILKKGRKMQKEPLKDEKPPEFCIMDRELHMAIVNSCLNQNMNKFYSHIYSLIRISQQLNPLYKRSLSEHNLLIKEILEGNTKKAKNILEKHLENYKKDSVKS